MRDRDLRLNLLVAYPYFKGGLVPILNRHADKIRLVIDSGAFTAWKSGNPIQLDDYCRFLDSLEVRPWRYFSLDVIGDPHGTAQNYQTMLRRGYNPVPVFTRGEDLSVLDTMYETSDVVAIGGLVGTQGNKAFVNGIMECVAGRRVHLLGFTSMEYLKHYRPYMCDSASWEGGAKFAQLALYMGKGRVVQLGKDDFARRPPADVVKAVKSYGFDPASFAQDANWSGGMSDNRVLNGFSAVRRSMDIQRNLGTYMFLALATAMAGCILLRGYLNETTGTQSKDLAL